MSEMRINSDFLLHPQPPCIHAFRLYMNQHHYQSVTYYTVGEKRRPNKWETWQHERIEHIAYGGLMRQSASATDRWLRFLLGVFLSNHFFFRLTLPPTVFHMKNSPAAWQTFCHFTFNISFADASLVAASLTVPPNGCELTHRKVAFVLLLIIFFFLFSALSEHRLHCSSSLVSPESNVTTGPTKLFQTMSSIECFWAGRLI